MMNISTQPPSAPETALDFASFLSERLGLPNDEAKGLLKAWLLSYEPCDPRPLRFLSGGSVVEVPPIDDPSR